MTVINQTGWIKTFLSATAILVPMTMASQAIAQRPKNSRLQPAIYNIPAQSLTGALAAFARSSRLKTAYPTALTDGKTAPAVVGPYTRIGALDHILSGTGLSYRFTGEDTVTIFKTENAAEGDNATTLAPIVIGADRATAGFVTVESDVGSKTDTPLVETPQSISVVTRDQITARGAQTVADAVKYTAGVSTEPGGVDGRYDQMFIRGFNAYITGDYRDGLRQPGRSYSYYRIEPYGLERLDILRGPTSVLYGQNQPGGMVDRVSKTPTTDHVNEIVMQGGTQSKIQGAFDLGGKVADNPDLTYRIVGLAKNADNLQSEVLPDDRLYVAPSLRWNITDDTTLTLLTEAMKDVTGYNFYYTAPGTAPTHISTGDPSFDQFRQEQYSLGYILEHRFSENLKFRQKLRYSDLSLDYQSIYGLGAVRAGTTLLPRTAIIQNEDLNALTLDNQGVVEFDTGPAAHQVLVGLDYQHWNSASRTRAGAGPDLDISNPVYGVSIPTPATTALSSRQIQDQLGIYLQDQIKFDEKLILTLSGRHDWAEGETLNRLTSVKTKTDDKAFTGRVGVTYLFDNGLAPYASYSTSFMPVVGTTSAARGATPFKPTEGEQYEVGLKYQPEGYNSFITASVFDLSQKNVTTTDPADITQKVQTGEVRSRGLELEAVASLDNGLSFSAAFTWQDVEVTKSNAADLGKRPTQIPDMMASLWADYTLQSGPLEGLGFGGGVRYVGSTYGNSANTIKNPAYTLVDAAVRYDLGKLSQDLQGWKAAINATNLFDKEYYVCSTGYCSWGSRRTVLATLKYQW